MVLLYNKSNQRTQPLKTQALTDHLFESICSETIFSLLVPQSFLPYSDQCSFGLAPLWAQYWRMPLTM